MKLYVVLWGFNEIIEGIYSTVEKALQAHPYGKTEHYTGLEWRKVTPQDEMTNRSIYGAFDERNCPQSKIEEWELDKTDDD